METKCRLTRTLSQTTTPPSTRPSTSSSWTRQTSVSTQQDKPLFLPRTIMLPATTSVRSWQSSQWAVTEGSWTPRNVTEPKLSKSRAPWAIKVWTCISVEEALTFKNCTSTTILSLKLLECPRTEWTTTKRKPLSSCRTTWSRRSLTRSMAPIHKTNNNSFYLARWRCKWLLARPQWPSISNTDHTQ